LQGITDRNGGIVEVDNRINEAARRYARKVNERFKPKAIYLYGSQAKGTANKYSDIDIAVVIEPINNIHKHIDLLSELMSIASDFEENIEPNLLEDDGEYDRFSFLAEVMETGQLIEI